MPEGPTFAGHIILGLSSLSISANNAGAIKGVSAYAMVVSGTMDGPGEGSSMTACKIDAICLGGR